MPSQADVQQIIAHATELARHGFDATGGAYSRLQIPQTYHLGHPDSGIIEAHTETGRAGSVWIHARTAPYPTPDDGTGEREPIPGPPLTAIRPVHLREALNTYGLQVEVVRSRQGLLIIGSAGADAADYMGGVGPVKTLNPITRTELDYLLMRPQDPPGRGVLLGGGVIRDGDTLINLPRLEIPDLITGNVSGLSTGQARAVLVSQDKADLTSAGIDVQQGSPFTDNRTTNGISDHAALFGDYPVSIPADHATYGHVKLYAGIERITAEDIYAALDTGGGGAGGAGFDPTIDTPLEGHTVYYDSGTGTWVNRYLWTGCKLLGPNDVDSVANTATEDLDFLINYDIPGVYDEGTNTLTLSEGVWQLKLEVQWTPDDTTGGAGWVRAAIAGTFAGETALDAGADVRDTPAGLTVNDARYMQVVAEGFVGTPTVFTPQFTNNCGQDVTINACWLAATRLRP